MWQFRMHERAVGDKYNLVDAHATFFYNEKNQHNSIKVVKMPYIRVEVVVS